MTGFGGDYALSALAAAGVHPADVHGRALDPSAQDYYADLWSRLRRRRARRRSCSGHAAGHRRAATVSVSTNLVALLATRVQPTPRLEGSFAGGATNLTAFSALGSRASARRRRARQDQRLPARPAAHRRRLELRPRDDRRPARGGEQRRHDRRRARRAVRDGSGSDRSRRAGGHVVPRGAAGPGHWRVRGTSTRPAGRCPGSTRAASILRAGGCTTGRVRDAAWTPCSPSRTRAAAFTVRRLAEPVLDAERGQGAGGEASRPTRRGARPPATRASAPRRSSPTVPTRRTCWRSTTATGDVRLCSVTAPAGASLAAFLAAAAGGRVAGRLRPLVRDQRWARDRGQRPRGRLARCV